MEDIDRELAAQLAERQARYKDVEDEELEADEVDDQLGELRQPETAQAGAGASASAWLSNARGAAGRLRRSVSVELELEGAAAEGSNRQEEHLGAFNRRRQRTPSVAPPAEEEPQDERACRMCLGEDGETEDDGTSLGPLIAPCSCKGSMKVRPSAALFGTNGLTLTPLFALLAVGACQVLVQVEVHFDFASER